MLNAVVWSKAGNLGALAVALVDVDTQDQRQPDHNSAEHHLDLASKEAFVDVVALEIEVGSEVVSMTEEEASEDVVASAVTEEDLVVIVVGLVAEEVLAIKTAADSRTVRHLLVHLVDPAPEVASVQAHPTAVMMTEDAMETVETDVVEEVAMTPEILVVLVGATETQLEMGEVGMATAIDILTGPDETTIMDPESDITRVNSMMIQDQSGGIEHHIPIEVCWWVSLCSAFRLLPCPFHIKGKKVLHYYQHLPEASARGWWFNIHHHSVCILEFAATTILGHLIYKRCRSGSKRFIDIQLLSVLCASHDPLG
jgi:hypothetical protein